jgi:hypothetical protein
MNMFIKHREVPGVYLCHEGIHWYWGPREQAKIYSTAMALTLIKAFPEWKYLLGVDQREALLEIDRTPETVPPMRAFKSHQLSHPLSRDQQTTQPGNNTIT